jgi:hypothetical protein
MFFKMERHFYNSSKNLKQKRSFKDIFIHNPEDLTSGVLTGLKVVKMVYSTLMNKTLRSHII